MLTHHNFKSLVPDVTSAEGMSDHVGRAICYQHLFDRRTSPWEASLWDEGELQRFCVSLERVDRLYHISHQDDSASEDDFVLLVRVEYNEQHLFVELSAGCRFTGFECRGGGDIFVSYNANLFTKTITTKVLSEERLYESLSEDGYEVEGRSEFDRPAVLGSSLWHQPPRLKFLCHHAVHRSRDQLGYYPKVLPAALIASVTEFLSIKDSIDYYDNWD